MPHATKERCDDVVIVSNQENDADRCDAVYLLSLYTHTVMMLLGFSFINAIQEPIIISRHAPLLLQ